MPIPSLTLKSGSQMPQVGLGLWKIPPQQVGGIIAEAVDLGYRHFDSACDYGNEAEAGAGLAAVFQAGKCRRDELWITSKLWNTYHAPEHVRPAIERTLSDLQLDHLDLYLIHFPIAQRFVPFDERYPPGWHFDPAAPDPHMEFERVALHETWQAMEELVTAGLTRHIGVCNYNTGLLRDLFNYATIFPEVLQVELHPLLTQEHLVRYAQEQQMVVTAFSSLGSPSYVPIGMANESESLLDHPTIRDIATRHNKTAAQVLLRWAIDRNTIVIPKSTRPERLKENIELFDFALTPEEVNAISSLNQNRRFNDPAVFGERAFGTFCPIYD